MVVAAKFGDRTLLLAFAGDAAVDGIDMGEEVVLAGDASEGGPAERVARRFTGGFMRPLQWQAAIESWARSNVTLGWNEEAHPADLQARSIRKIELICAFAAGLLRVKFRGTEGFLWWTQELWRLSFPDREAPARKDPRWSALGFQQADPATDFRGAGMVALQLMLALAREHTQVPDPLRAPARSYRVA